MPFQPRLSGQRLDGTGQRVVDLRPRLAKLGGRDPIGRRPVRIRKEILIQLDVKSHAKAQERQHAVVHGREMAQQIEDPILTGGDLLLQLLVAEGVEHLVEPVEVDLPLADGGAGEEVDRGCV